eukprot:11193367-Heterocapsa_arctica.AAC.1
MDPGQTLTQGNGGKDAGPAGGRRAAGGGRTCGQAEYLQRREGRGIASWACLLSPLPISNGLGRIV